MSLADEVLAKHTKEYKPWSGVNHEGKSCNRCGVPWPCESVRLALSLQAAEQVVEAARKWHYNCGGTPDLPDDTEFYRALAEYDKGDQG